MAYRTKLWTSDLFIQTDLDNESDLVSKVSAHAQRIESKFSKFSENTESYVKLEMTPKLEDLLLSEFREVLTWYEHLFIPFITYNGTHPDFTGLLKGYFLDLLSDSLLQMGSKSFLIDFGGDIIGHNVKSNIHREFGGPAVFLNLSGDFKVFSSGNHGSRGNHIKVKGSEVYMYATLVSKSSHVSCTEMDMLSTLFVSDSNFASNPRIKEDVLAILTNVDNKLEVNGSWYVASPFFTEDEIKLRDKMILDLSNYFRPDESDANKGYSASDTKSHNEAIARKIMEDNVKELRISRALVFPEGTDDVGTLFEIGLAMKLKLPIVRYSNVRNAYILCDSDRYESLLVSNYSVVDCRTVSGPVVLGYNYPDETLGYYLGGIKDNLMISTNFHKMEQVGENFIEVEKNYEEIR